MRKYLYFMIVIILITGCTTVSAPPNAVKYTGETQSITVRVGGLEEEVNETTKSEYITSNSQEDAQISIDTEGTNYLAICQNIPKYALVIGNSKYEHFSELPNSIEETEELCDTLNSIGFNIFYLKNGSKEETLDALYDFEENVKGKNALAYFHYSGHGVQVDGKNYLIPVDANIENERRVRTRAIDLDDVIITLENASPYASVIVLDACRNNPLPGVFRDAKKGLSIIERQPKNSIIIYSAEAGMVARDGIFTPIFIKYLRIPNIELTDILRNVRREVREKTNGMQRPGEYNQLESEIYLNARVDE